MASVKQSRDGVWRVQVYALGKRASATFRTKREANTWGAQTERRLSDSVKHRRDLEKKIGAGNKKLTAEDILNGRVKVTNHPGIYILFSGDKVTYVGQSKNVIKRIASHADKGRPFDSYHVIPCLPCDLEETERYYIDLLSPPENKTQIMQRALPAKQHQLPKPEFVPHYLSGVFPP